VVIAGSRLSPRSSSTRAPARSKAKRTPVALEFKRDGKIRPVAPFLEVFAVTDKDKLVPLTVGLLRKQGLTVKDISWKSGFRTAGAPANPEPARTSSTPRSSSPTIEAARFTADAKISSEEASVDFGSVRFIRPNDHFPEIRFRFTPAAGLIYGSLQTGKDLAAEDEDPGYYQVPEARRIYKHRPNHKAQLVWLQQCRCQEETVPPSLFAIEPPAPSWLYDNRAISRAILTTPATALSSLSETARSHARCDGPDLLGAAGDGTRLPVCALPSSTISRQ